MSGELLELDGESALVTVSWDVTAKKRAEREMIAAREEAELANRTKSEFLANVSHELRTPLNAIMGFAQMMESEIVGPITEQQSGYLEDISNSGTYLLDIINDVIDLSSAELGHLNLVKAETEIGRCVDACVRLAASRIRDKNLKLRLMDFAQVPKFHADERRVKQVILNLLTNAAKYTENGGRIEIDAVANDGGFIEVRVKDTGIGMSADELARVITPFIQGGDPMVRLSEGSGLGLPLVQSIVDAHGGTLSIESNVGVGTTAIVTFPISG